MNDIEVKGIPYGVSDYEKIVEKNYYYVDKTIYLPLVEKAGDYLFFIRPRRFGKSLFLSMMKCYYDVLFNDQFEKLFKGTWIYDNPTEERGKYLVLSLNFSSVDPSRERLERSFREMIRKRVFLFVDQYAHHLGKQQDYFIDEIEKASSSTDIMGYLNRLVRSAGQKMYVIIDEYDNFAKTLLTASGEGTYRDLTHGDGFLRSFFNVLKAGTGDVGSPIARLFITGVSPITMDDVTSGFNIGENVSLDLNLNRMLGFTTDDVTNMIEYYRQAGKISPDHTTTNLIRLMTRWYGNYFFSADDNVSLLNSDMVLYFLKNYMKQKRLPDDLIDHNVKIDYGKLRHLIIIDRADNKLPTTNGNFSNLKEIIREGGTLSRISTGFPLKGLIESVHFKSLLFFFGLLTIDGREKGSYRLVIPNETIKRLYFDYIERVYKETGVFSLNLSLYGDLIRDMAFDGDWRPLLEFITTRMKESFALRDLITGEKAVQTFLNVYLGLSDLFIVHTEKEMNKGYADMVLEPFTAKYPELNHTFLLELKYVKAGMKPGDPKLTHLINEAEEQIRNYALDKKFTKTVGKPNGKTQIVKLVLIFSGHEALYISDVE